ncbi:MAG: glycosyltransferase family 2 protein [Hyphomicrobiaceae bacterium]
MPKLVSVVIEWENAKLSDLDRAERMLAQLGTQMAEEARKRDLSAELIVLYDSDAIDPAVPSTAIETQIDRAAWPGPIKLVPAPGQRYYEQKNKGAKLASGEVVIFLDSDVVPDEGWLEGLLAALDDPEIGIVGGETYHTTDTLHDKLFAAFWTFPTRRPSRGLCRYKNFYANNFAVRRELFLAHPFPDAPAYRGQCAALAKSLMRQGTAIYRQGTSRVSHPPPEGARTFVVRALCLGYDSVYWRGQRRFGPVLDANPIGSLLRFVRQLWEVLVRVATRARTIGLGPLGILAAIGMGFAFYALTLAGEVVAFFAPGVIRNNLSV